MMRRLIETLISEDFIHKKIDSYITDSDSKYLSLDELVGQATSGKLDLSRDTKRELSSVKNLGDKSAHNRKFRTRRGGIDNLKLHFRATGEEFIAILRE